MIKVRVSSIDLFKVNFFIEMLSSKSYKRYTLQIFCYDSKKLINDVFD